MSSEEITVSKPNEGLTCKEFIGALVDYLARELPASERDKMNLHLEICPDCVRYLESYDVTIKLGKKAMADDGEAALPDDFVNVVISATRKRS